MNKLKIPNNGSTKKPIQWIDQEVGPKKNKQTHNKSIKTSYQCAFRVGQSCVALDLGLLHYYCMEHVENQGVPCNGHQATTFKGTHLEYVS
jgi:hypothetical protein